MASCNLLYVMPNVSRIMSFVSCPTDHTWVLLKAVCSGLMGRAIALLAPLIIMGPMLQYLGSAQFGAWLMAVSVAAMTAVLDFGIGSALLTRLSHAFGKNDFTLVRCLVGQAYLLLSIVTVGAIFLLCITLSAAAYTNSNNGVAWLYIKTLGVVLTSSFLGFLSGVVVRLLQSRQSYVHAQAIMLCSTVAGLGAALAGIGLRLKPFHVICLYAFAAPITQSIWSLVFFARNPSLSPIFSIDSHSAIRSFGSLGGSYFVVSVLMIAALNLDTTIIAFQSGPAVVTQYGIPARLGALTTSLVANLFMPLWSLYGDAIARADHLWIRRSSRLMSAVGIIAVLVGGTLLVIFSEVIIQCWVKQSFPEQALVISGMVLLGAAIAFTGPFNMILNAAGMARQQITPWALMLCVSFFAKLFISAPPTTWCVPWITAGCYLTCITLPVLVMSNEYLREITSKETMALRVAEATVRTEQSPPSISSSGL